MGESSVGPTRRVGWRFVLVYALAYTGTWIALLTPVLITIALKIRQLTPDDAAATTRSYSASARSSRWRAIHSSADSAIAPTVALRHATAVADRRRARRCHGVADRRARGNDRDGADRLVSRAVVVQRGARGAGRSVAGPGAGGAARHGRGRARHVHAARPAGRHVRRAIGRRLDARDVHGARADRRGRDPAARVHAARSASRPDAAGARNRAAGIGSVRAAIPISRGRG